MELRHLRYFLAVAEEGNFTRAAGKLGIGQPPLSQQIRDLEREVGAALFHRVPHGAELTAAGTAFLGEAKASLAAAEKAKLAAQSANRGETGRLSLGFTASSAFNPVVSTTIRRFRARWPEVQLSLTEMNTLALMQKLERGELDATFMLWGLADAYCRRMPLRRDPLSGGDRPGAGLDLPLHRLPAVDGLGLSHHSTSTVGKFHAHFR